MSEVITKNISTFGWVEMAANDLASAKKFYSAIFNWKGELMNENSPMPYAIMKTNENPAAGIYELTQDMKQRQIPPHWLAYILVDDVDERCRVITNNGGQVLQPAFDVETVGRIAVAQDPTGGVFAIWKASDTAMDLPTGKYTSCWYELGTTDTVICRDFYGKVFGWEFKVDTSMEMEYVVINKDEKMLGGMYVMPENMKEMPPNWAIYFEVPDYNKSSDQIISLGGKQVGPVMDIKEIGKFGYFLDPQGAMFVIIQSAEK